MYNFQAQKNISGYKSPAGLFTQSQILTDGNGMAIRLKDHKIHKFILFFLPGVRNLNSI